MELSSGYTSKNFGLFGIYAQFGGYISFGTYLEICEKDIAVCCALAYVQKCQVCVLLA